MAPRIPVIVDADPGVDDMLAFLVLLADPRLQIMAITTSMGNTSEINGYNNTVKILANVVRHVKARPETAKHWPHLFEDRIILMHGAKEPRGGELIDAGYFHGFDGLSDIETTHTHLTPSDEEKEALYRDGVLARPPTDVPDAPALIHRILAAHPPQAVGFLTLGPVTTLAAAIALDQQAFFSHCRLVVSMAGAFDVPGNTTAVAEFNVRADPYALHEVLRSGLGRSSDPTTPRWLMVPVDLTTRHTLPFTTYSELVDPSFLSSDRPGMNADPLIQLTSAILKRTQGVMEKLGGDGVELHDPLAAWCLAAYLTTEGDAQPAGWLTQRRLFDVERKGELTRGMLVIDRRKSAKEERGRDRSQQRKPAPVQVPDPANFHPAGAYEPSEVEVVVDTPGIEAMRQVQLASWGPLRTNGA